MDQSDQNLNNWFQQILFRYDVPPSYPLVPSGYNQVPKGFTDKRKAYTQRKEEDEKTSS